jgi:hypothetical protein
VVTVKQRTPRLVGEDVKEAVGDVRKLVSELVVAGHHESDAVGVVEDAGLAVQRLCQAFVETLQVGVIMVEAEHLGKPADRHLAASWRPHACVFTASPTHRTPSATRDIPGLVGL